MPEIKRVFVPKQLYDIEVKIKGLDYSNEMIGVVIGSSLTSAYQVITLSMLIDPTDIIVEDIFGGEAIKLRITLNREFTYPGPAIDVDLMYVTSNFQLIQKEKLSSIPNKDRTVLSIVTVVRAAYKTMNTLVNKVFIGKKLSEIISQLATDVGADLEYDQKNQNKEVISQVCIPPTTFYKIIKEHTRNDPDVFDGYLDQRFGLFDGVPGVFCQHDNKVYIKNLTDKFKKDQVFTVYQLASFQEKKESEKIFNETSKGNTFYTYDTINTDYSGNAKFAKLGTTLNHLIRPKDKLTKTITQDLKDIASDYSLVYSAQGLQPELNIDPTAERVRYYNEDTGFDESKTIFNSRYARTISDLSSISINIERNLPVLNLIEVGECVKFKPMTIEYQDFEGKYILWSSEVSFTRKKDWETTARINLIRTNKKK